MKSSIKDVARRAGVSIATVSHVIHNTHNVSEEKRHRVLNAIEGLNYKPNVSARNLRTQKASHLGIFLCELYTAKNPWILSQTLRFLIDAIEGNSYSAFVRFVSPKTILSFSETQPECKHSFLITDSVDSYSHINFTEHKLFPIDMAKTGPAKVSIEEKQKLRFHYAGYYYFTWIANFISDNLDKNFCFFMPREDLRILQELFSANINYESIFSRIKIVNSEMSEAQIELSELLEKNVYDNIYLTDYKFALGTVRLLLQKPEYAHTRTTITFYSYNCAFENFNMLVKDEPFFLSKTDIEEIVSHAWEEYPA